MRNARLWAVLIVVSLIALAVSAPSASAQMGVWRDINPDAYLSPAANPQLNSVYMLNSSAGWAVGDSRPTTNTTTGLPGIFYYDGSTWNLVPAPKIADFPSGQAAYNLTSVTFGPPGSPISGNNGWAVGYNSTLDGTMPPSTPNVCGASMTGPSSPDTCAEALHWDGITWRTETAGLTGPNSAQLWSAFMDGSTDVWAVGQNNAGTMGVFWHWTGVPGLGGGWNMPQAPVSCPNTNLPCGIYSVFMVSPTEGWAVGAQGLIFHYIGGTWNSFSSPISCPAKAPSCTSLRSIFMISPTEGWAVGDGGIIIHYSSGTWSGPVSPGTTSNNLFSVFMLSSTQGWAFGAKGSVLQYTGGSWTLLSSNLIPTSPVDLFNFNSGFFNSASDGWVVGTDGVVVHFDGVNYGTVTSPTMNNFTSISFGPPLTGPINPSDGWAVGNASVSGGVLPSEPTIYHWDGFAWTKGVAIGTTNNLNSVFMVNTGDVWAVGGGPNPTASCSGPLCPVILNFAGGSWNTITPPPGNYVLKSIFMVSSNEGWAVGEQAPTCALTTTTTITTSSATTTSTTTNSACYPTGIILHYTVSGGVGTWAVFPPPTSPAPIHGLNSVFMLDQDEGWAVGDNATILHYTVTGGVGTWNLVTVSGTPTVSVDANFTSIYMLSPTSGWAVGGTMLNPGCMSTASPPTFGPCGNPDFPLQAEPPTNVGAFAAGPVIIHWDGTTWEPVAVPTIPGGISPTGHTSGTLKSVFFTAPDDGWAVGFPGITEANILHWDGVSWQHVSLSPALLGQIPPILSSVYMTSETSGWIVGGSPDFQYCTTGPSTCYFSQATPAPTDSRIGIPAPGQEDFGYKTPLSTMLEFAPYGGVFSTTSTSVVLSTASTSTTAVTTTTSSTISLVCPPNVTISIKVVNNQGNPVSGATVALGPAVLTPCLPSPVQGTTNSQGIVTFTVPPGTYAATLSKNGVTSAQTITITTSGQVITVTLNASSGGPIPGFPIESIIAGAALGLVALTLLRRRRRVR